MSSIQPDWDEPAGSPGAVPRYVNGTEITYTQWDMTLDFQLAAPEKTASTGELRFVAQRVARIVVSPTHAKVLADIIRGAVDQWEARFGVLPDAATLLAPGPVATPEGETGGRSD